MPGVTKLIADTMIFIHASHILLYLFDDALFMRSEIFTFANHCLCVESVTFFYLCLGCWRTELPAEATEAQNLDVIPTHIMMQNSLTTVEA